MKKTEKRYMTMKEAMEYTGMGELTLLETLRVIDAYPIQPNGEGTRRLRTYKRQSSISIC